jgi:HSP20 family molecular chaperone IbpA
LDEKYTEAPEIISFVDSEQSKLFLEISLVDVETENISLMMDENGCYLSAPAEGVEYKATLSFLRAVKPAEAKAKYLDGYLKVEVPFKDPVENYLKIPVESIE